MIFVYDLNITDFVCDRLSTFLTTFVPTGDAQSYVSTKMLQHVARLWDFLPVKGCVERINTVHKTRPRQFLSETEIALIG